MKYLTNEEYKQHAETFKKFIREKLPLNEFDFGYKTDERNYNVVISLKKTSNEIFCKTIIKPHFGAIENEYKIFTEEDKEILGNNSIINKKIIFLELSQKFEVVKFCVIMFEDKNGN